MASIVENLGKPYTELLEKRVTELISFYKDTSARLRALLLSVDSITPAKSARITELVRQVDKEISRLRTFSTKWSKESTASAFRYGITNGLDELNGTGKLGTAVQMDSVLARAAVEVAVTSAVLDFEKAVTLLRNSTVGYLLNTQQELVAERTINLTVAGGLAVGSPRTVRKTLLDLFREQLGSGNLIQVQGRNYKPAYYAELVANSKMMQAYNDGKLLTFQANEIALVRISTHFGACDKCVPYQGKIYSLTGYAGLPAPPQLPIHPYCRHNYGAVLVDEIQGQEAELLSEASSNTPLDIPENAA